MGWLFAEESITGSFTHGAFTAYLVATVLILLTVRYRKKIQEHLSYRKKMLEIAEELPGLPTIPILGNAHKFRDTDRTVMILAEIGKELNATVFRVWFGPMLKIFITNPDDIEILMKKPQAAYKEHMYSFMDAAVIDTLINGSGKIYRSHKKLMVPLINGANFLPDHTKEFNRQTKIMVKNMAKYADAGEYNVEHTLVPCVADIVWETLYGEPGTSQTGAYNVFVEMSEMMLHILWKRTWAVWFWPDMIFNISSQGRVFNRLVKVAHSVFVEMIEKKRKIHAELRKQGIEPEKVKTSMLDQIVAHVTQTGTWTTEQIRDECLTIFIGSHDTICGIAGFATLMLAMFPDIQERVREETKNVAGDEDIIEDHLTEMTYLDMVVREVIRLFPVGPLLGRHLHGDVKLTSCTLPEGSSVLMLPMVTHRDPRYWDDPESFNPERFSPENSKGRHPFAYIPFSGGLRSCPGSKYGMHCIKILMIQMVRNYRLETKLTYDQLRLNTHLSVRCANENKISITKLKNI